ncbi:uncharacterized protein HMPREF1541_06294 [Cyphellophora europaea CBS 101466]|uniref:Cytochrome P450 n=1 Tax=Cyphellophora europaea (strain CBS 101466) TaxID=1220924 RepID=W2RRB8_CYPE1|nr:uncharacterized protein HMPREF1541_06294 [Cyphellophora europaea CBS 101466]ETN38263.1 hypothetical protein HMPREF1541_06294 [Cyphellophora europaea CBS 101466]
MVSSLTPTIYTPLYLFSFLLAYLVLARLYRLYTNYALARHQNLPIIVLPWSWQDPLWMLLAPRFLWLRHLPWFSTWIPYSYMGWTTQDKGRIHRPPPLGLGPAFIVVSPSRTEFFTTDPQTAVAVKRNWREYEHPPDLYAVFDVFGPNLLSANGPDWQRHRKIVGGAFREAVYPTVWRESWARMDELMEKLVRAGRMTLEEVRKESGILAMHVLGKAAFGSAHGHGEEGVASNHTGHRLSYLECLEVMYPNLMGVILFGGLKTSVPDWILPKPLKRVKTAVEEYRLYLLEAVQRQQKKGTQQGGAVADLATLLVRANDAEKEEDPKSGHLTAAELYGNMFIFNIAGYETTAMSLSFAIPYLAAFPDVQAWARDEVDEVFGKSDTLSYEEAYERLPRVRAVMYETLRLHSSVAHLPHESPSYPTTIEVPSLNRSIDIPPKSLVSIPVVISGYLPTEFNGPDPYLFAPSRFLTLDSTGAEVLLSDNELAKQGWIPWAVGPRVCPGKKFSQVEFVSAIAQLLLRAEVRVADQRGEGMERATARVKEGLTDTEFNLGTTVRRTSDIGLEFVARAEVS